MLEALLAYAHLLAILSWVVFLTSQTALARAEWFNTAALNRLVTVARIANIAAGAVFLSGAARVIWGAKGPAWTLAQPLLWAKLALFTVMVIAAWRSTRQIARWHTDHQRSGALPGAEQITQLRQRLMRATHLMVWLPLLGVLLARGLLAR